MIIKNLVLKVLRFKTFILYFSQDLNLLLIIYLRGKILDISFYFLAIMEIAIGTSGLKNKFDKNYWDIFTSAIENGSFIHTALNYENVGQYFQMAHEEGIKITKTIIKIEISRNPLKKILNINKQINLILEKFKLENVETIQVCNKLKVNIYPL